MIQKKNKKYMDPKERQRIVEEAKVYVNTSKCPWMNDEKKEEVRNYLDTWLD